MGYDNPQRGSAGTVLAVMAIIAVLLLGGLVLLGVAALFFARTSARQSKVARMEVDRAVEQVVEAEEVVARVQVEESATVEMHEASGREVSIEIDRDGAIMVDDKSTDLDGLRAQFQRDREGGDFGLAVRLEVDPRCPAQHVVGVYTVCSESGIKDLRISMLEVPSRAITDEGASTAETSNAPSQ